VVEAYTKESLWSQGKEIIISDHEKNEGRKDYAEDVGGGYYSSRLPVLEWMNRNNRRGTAIIVREIDKSAPVGVWKIRETCRRALKKEPEKYDTLKKAREAMKNKLKIGNKWEKESEIMKDLRSRNILMKHIEKGED